MNNDLISRKALKKVMWDEAHFITTISECGTEVACYGLTINEIEQIIDNAPTVDVLTAVWELYKRYQPRLATNVYEFGVELQELLGRYGGRE